MQQVRPPAVAGSFYQGHQQTLANDVDELLEGARLSFTETPVTPKAIIVPHAGYIYSGAVAATAYATLFPLRHRIKRVVLLGPVHHVPVRGLALPGVDLFATPLGEIKIDQNAVAAIENLPQVVVSNAAHAQEHSLEVQLPFLQSVLDDFKLLPLAVGDVTPQQVAEVLEVLWGGPETLIVISSDLSHFLPYQTAQVVDAQTVQNILGMNNMVTHEQACGGTPVNGLMLAARHHQLQAHLLDLRNSGDTAGDKNRVVGYASFAFNENIHYKVKNSDEDIEADAKGKILLSLARAAISKALGQPFDPVPNEDASWLQQQAACFVTLTQKGQLRGCIGTLQAHRSLLNDVTANAKAVAFEDTRFSPLSVEELNNTDIEISLLSAMQPLSFANEQEALTQLRPGIDGVLFEFEDYHSTFLPQVWQQLPETTEFIAQLKQKAGLSANFWSNEIKLSRYTVKKWKEQDFLSRLEGEMS